MKYEMKQFKNIKYTMKDNGSKTTIVMIHGYKSSSDTFLPLYDLENNFNIISINYPGNKYYKEEENYSAQEIGKFLDKVISGITTDVILLGHSFGGPVISEIKNKRKIKGYVFISAMTSSILDSRLHASLIRIGNKNLPTSVINKMLAIASKQFKFDLEYAKGFLEPNKGFKVIFKENILNKNYIKEILNKKISNISKPITAIIGNKDVVIPVNSYINYFKEMNVETKIINGAKHNPMKSDANIINDILNDTYEFKERNKKNIIKQQD